MKITDENWSQILLESVQKELLLRQFELNQGVIKDDLIKVEK